LKRYKNEKKLVIKDSYIEIDKANGNNLKNISIKFPLKNFKQSEANKEFLKTAKTAVFKQHADLRENAEG
jgi:hypothetical protein